MGFSQHDEKMYSPDPVLIGLVKVTRLNDPHGVI